MFQILMALLETAVSAFRHQQNLAIENLALRQQLAIYKRATKRPKLTGADRLFWVALLRLSSTWRHALIAVKPETVVGWHRKGFRMFWSWKSRHRAGRPKVRPETRALIQRMAEANGWGAPRIHGELLKLGIDVSQATVSRYMPRPSKPPSQTWRMFLENHVGTLASIDFFVVPTATFTLLFGFLGLRHDRRQVVHFNVTANPTAVWTAQQIVEAFPYDSAPRYIVRDRDGIYGAEFVARVERMGIHEVVTAPRSPWQNPYVERLIGSIRRECLNHVIVLGENHCAAHGRGSAPSIHSDGSLMDEVLRMHRYGR
jgi:putative transposase